MNSLFLADFYKVGHIEQYPKGVTQIWSNWTARSSRIKDQHHTVHFGLQYFIKKILIEHFNKEFFNRSLQDVIGEYLETIRATLNIEHPKADHIYALWELGYLPIDIYSLPEGSAVPLGVPSLVITNTHADFFWLPNYLETMLSAYLWKPTTSATTAKRFRKIFEKYALMAKETDLSFIDWQGHDFSMRGMSGIEDAILSGMGHLTSFKGTDTIPAILAANKYYNAGLTCGGSVPATEHSVMCAGGKEDEFNTFKRLITEIYPSGIVSIVSDTWDLWKVLTEYLPALKKDINYRDGKVVIRPDSGDPVKIICGDPKSSGPAKEGTLRLLGTALGHTLGTNGTLPLITNGGAIYGDSITTERAEQILDRMVNELHISPYNMVFGIGSYTYEYTTRDTYGFAMKATAFRNSEEKVIPIFKKPITDDGKKFSHKGIPAVYFVNLPTSPGFMCIENSKPQDLDRCAFQKVFSDGKLLINVDFQTIKDRIKGTIPCKV